MENNEILNNNNIGNIIEDIQRNYNNMNIKDAIKTVDILYKQIKKNKKNLYYTNLTSSKEFKQICKVIYKNVRSLSIYDTINILRNLLFLNVPSDTVIIQTLLQLIRISLNDLTVGQIMILYNMLYKVEVTPLIKVLLPALSHVFNERAQIELNSNSINLLQALEFCFIINNSKIKRHIINILIKNKQKINSDYMIDIFHVIYSLPKLCLSSKQLLLYIQNIIITYCKRLNFNEINYLLNCISEKFMNS